MAFPGVPGQTLVDPPTSQDPTATSIWTRSYFAFGAAHLGLDVSDEVALKVRSYRGTWIGHSLFKNPFDIFLDHWNV